MEINERVKERTSRIKIMHKYSDLTYIQGKSRFWIYLKPILEWLIDLKQHNLIKICHLLLIDKNLNTHISSNPNSFSNPIIMNPISNALYK
jgi:hypothetical protein